MHVQTKFEGITTLKKTNYMNLQRPVYITRRNLKKALWLWKRIKMFSVYGTSGTDLKTQHMITDNSNACVQPSIVGGSYIAIATLSFSKSYLLKMFCVDPH